MQQIRRSKIQGENTFYLRYNSEGVTSRVNSSEQLTQAACYREVHNLGKYENDHQGQKLFIDEDYQIDLGTEFADDDVVVKRLSNLYPITNRPLFFDLNSSPSRPSDPKKAPHCLNELALFPTAHYRSLFITQTYSPSGRYTLITNINGRFEVIVVDDRIPVYRDTLEPVWGMSYRNPWELILIKAFAKKLQGYHRILLIKPFEFIENFTNPTWKYYNLTKSPELFIHKYIAFSKSKQAKIVLKSKDENNLREHGILPNSASFQIVKGFVQAKDGKEQAYLAVRGTSKSSWPGAFGYLDKHSSEVFQQISPQISLERCFIISGDDLLNNFSAAYLTSIRQDNYFTGYKILEIGAGQKKAQHFEFEMPADGFFDFCIKQFPENAVTATNQSRINVSSIAKGHRYLQNKYILVRDNLGRESSNSLFPTNLAADAHNQHSSIINSNLYTTNANQYKQPRFTVYEIEYLKGYNKGEAHFLRLEKGRYILRLKSELVNKNAKYSINWVSSSRLDIFESRITKQEKVDLLHEAIVSFMHKGQNYSLEKGKKTEMISYGNTFDEIGYGFVSVKSTVSCPYSILLEVDPETLRKEGYLLKGKYRNERQPFKIIIQKGEFDSVVFKRDKSANQYYWPTQAFKVWKKQEKPEESVVKQSQINNANRGGNTQNVHITESRIINANPNPHEEDLYQNEAAQH